MSDPEDNKAKGYKIQSNTVDDKKPNAILLMHTDPHDSEGPNLYAVANELGIADKIIFSTDRVEFEKINVLHNISDVCVNISYAEGFGLATLEAMQTGTPIIAVKTGGLTRQVVDHRDGKENGVALDVVNQSLVGSQVRARLSVVDTFGTETILVSQPSRTIENVNNEPTGQILIRRVSVSG